MCNQFKRVNLGGKIGGDIEYQYRRIVRRYIACSAIITELLKQMLGKLRREISSINMRSVARVESREL